MEDKSVKKIVSPLELISTTDIYAVQKKLASIQKFRALVKATLQKGYDYGIIAGKPVLLKPGAEKLIVLLGLRTTFNIVDKVEDWDKGFFAYTVKCTLLYGDQVITEGLGHANTRENNRVGKNPYSEANNVLKMAEKRALVDAALHAGTLSDVFTQDLEDLIERNHNNGSKGEKPISVAQLKRLYAIAGKGNIGIIEEVAKEYGYDSLKDIKRKDYEAIVNEVSERTSEHVSEKEQ